MATITNDELPLPVEVIFSCAICQATIPEIYLDTEQKENIHDPGNAEHSSPATKFWLTSCCHLTCSKHLEGGGVPFYAAGDRPRAACPVCTMEHGDSTKKDLYKICGTRKGTYHPGIPSNFFETPPIRLDGTDKGMEALRFHYMSLVRFGSFMLAKHRRAKLAIEEAKKQAADQETARHQIETNLQAVRRRVTMLEQCERELKPWKEREPKIKHYLGVFAEITRENEKLREQLTAMGYAVPIRNYTLPEKSATLGQEDMQQSEFKARDKDQTAQGVPSAPVLDDHRAIIQSGSSRTLSAHGEPVWNSHAEDAERDNARKRKRAQDDVSNLHQPTNPSEQARTEERVFKVPPFLMEDLGKGHIRGQRAGTNSDFPQEPQIHAKALQSDSHRPLSIRPPSALEQSNSLNPNSISDDARPFRGPDEQPLNFAEPTFHWVQNQYLPSSLPPTGITNEHTPRSQNHQQEGYNVQHEPSRSVLTQSFPGIGLDAPRLLETPVHKQPPLARDSFNATVENLSLERIPLHEQREATLNIQRTGYSGPRSDESRPDFSQFSYQRPDQRSFSSPLRSSYRIPRTPSPIKQPFLSLTQSITSPFFSKSIAPDYTGRVTLPSRSRAMDHSSSQASHTRASPSRRAAADAFRMPPPPRRPTANRRVETFQTPSSGSGRSRHYEDIAEYSAVNPAFGRPPSTPLRPALFAAATPRTSEGLFRRPDFAAGHTPPGPPYSQESRPSASSSFYPVSQVRDIPRTLPSTPSVFQLPELRGTNSISNMGLSRSKDQNTGYWASGSRSGVSRLSQESGRRDGVRQGGSSPRKSVRR